MKYEKYNLKCKMSLLILRLIENRYFTQKIETSIQAIPRVSSFLQK